MDVDYTPSSPSSQHARSHPHLSQDMCAGGSNVATPLYLQNSSNLHNRRESFLYRDTECGEATTPRSQSITSSIASEVAG